MLKNFKTPLGVNVWSDNNASLEASDGSSAMRLEQSESPRLEVRSGF